MSRVTPLPNLDQLVVFHGGLNAQEAHVYLRLDVGQPAGVARLRGHIQGPLNLLTRTLPATIPFHDRGPGSGLLAGSVVPDPCFWAPGQPYLYDVQAQLVIHHDVVAEASFAFGMRMCGVQAGQLFLEARPWTLLGAAEQRVKNSDLSAWREASLVRLVCNPTEDFCERASREGVMMIAEMGPPAIEETGSTVSKSDAVLREVRRLSRHASVAIVAISEQVLDTADWIRQLRSVAPNLLLAQRLASGREKAAAAWADLLICDVDQLPALAARLKDSRQAVLVQQASDGILSIDQATDLCGRLGAELSAIDCVAGCLV